MAEPEKATVTIRADGSIILLDAIRDRMGWGGRVQVVAEDMAKGVLLREKVKGHRNVEP